MSQKKKSMPGAVLLLAALGFVLMMILDVALG